MKTLREVRLNVQNYLEQLDKEFAELRILRDQAYGHPISDKEWENCKGHWYADRAWLREQGQSMLPQ